MTTTAIYEHPDLDEKLTLRFPTENEAEVDQDEEWCEIVTGGEKRRIRFHDYHELYDVPGLYEHIFYERLECESPQTVCELLEQDLREDGFDPTDLRVIDVGAGNGMMGEELAKLGASAQVGVDIIEQAKRAAERDRPEVYDEYVVVDLTDPGEEVRRRMRGWDFNCLVVVAALGFGDIPPLAFAEAFNYVETGGYIAINIKEDFLERNDSTGFAALIRRMINEGVLEERGKRDYRHRMSLAGEPLYYSALVAFKNEDVPMEWAREAEAG